MLAFATEVVGFVEDSDNAELVGLYLMCVDDDPTRLITMMGTVPQYADIMQRAFILMLEEAIHRIGQRVASETE